MENRHTPYAVFDMDGTLIDTNTALTKAAEDYLARRGINPADHWDFFVAAATMSDRQLCAGMLEITGEQMTTDEALAELEVEVRQVYLRLDRTKPCVKEYLEKLRGQGVRMCIASATEQESIKYVLGKLELLDYFEFIISTSEVGKSKDFPDIYYEAARRFGIGDTSIATVYDDAPAAIHSAHIAGYRTVAVADDLHGNDPAKFPEADLYIYSFKELL